MSFNSDCTFEVNAPAVISETIDGETIIINLASGTYYSLKHTGSAIWAAIQQSANLGGIAALIRSTYDVNGHDVEHEISALVQRLVEEDLVLAKFGDVPPSAACVPPPEKQLPTFLAPILDKFTDMEAMLLLDPVHDVDEKGWPNMPAQDSRLDA
jgi:hypothetical protein